MQSLLRRTAPSRAPFATSDRSIWRQKYARSQVVRCRSETAPDSHDDVRKKAARGPLEGWRRVSSTAAITAPLIAPLPSRAAEHSDFLLLADIDAATAAKIATVLSPVLSFAILLMIVRVPLSWYPNLDVRKFPWVLPVALTEPVLRPTRKAVPPVGGVDVAPIIWVAVLTFLNEILLGPQGILNLLQRKVDF